MEGDPPTGRLRTTLKSEYGSIMVTVPDPVFATTNFPFSVVIARGSVPTAIRRSAENPWRVNPVADMWFEAELTTATEQPPPTATPAGAAPTASRSNGVR